MFYYLNMNVNSLIEEKFINGGGSLSRKQRDRLVRRADILRAAEHVFALKGFHEATMQDIAGEAEYAIGTVYLYFKDKDALYISLIEQKFKDLLSVLKTETAKVKSAKAKIETFISEKLSFFERNQNFFRIFVSERSKEERPGIARPRHSLITQHKEFAAELVKLGQQENLIRNDYTPKQIAEVLISVFMSVVFNWLKEPRGSNLQDTSGFIMDIFLNGAKKNR